MPEEVAYRKYMDMDDGFSRMLPYSIRRRRIGEEAKMIRDIDPPYGFRHETPSLLNKKASFFCGND